MTNATQATQAEKPENAAAALFVFLSAVVAITGNGIVILSFFINKKLRSQAGNCFIINLALADFLGATYVQMPCVFNLANPEWYFTGTTCRVHSVLTWMLLTSSNWTLAAISADRALAILKPFQHPNLVTTFRVWLVILSIWSFSFTFSAISITYTDISYESWELSCTPKWTIENVVSGSIAVVVCFCLPTVAVLGCNISIIYTVRNLRKIVTFSHSQETGEVSVQLCFKDHAKTLRGLYVLVAVYFTCVFPYFIAKFSFLTKERGILPPSLFTLTILMIFFAAAINPFIYTLLRSDHKEAFLKTLNLVADKLRNFFSICIKKKDDKMNQQSNG